MNSSIKISIVIPTRNRPETLLYSLQTVLAQRDPNFEIVVSDNSDDNVTCSLINQLADHRIVYVKTPTLLSMTDNWNHAFKAVSGDYVLYIGDDDGLCVDGLLNLRNAIDEFSACAYKWNTTEYQWPIDGHPAKVISFASNPSKNKTYNLKFHAEIVMRCGGWFYYKLPGVYHAAIKKSVLDSVERHNNGKLFLTTQPDLFTAMAVPQYCDSYVKLCIPVSIQGRSAKSNGGSSVASNGEETVQRFIKEYGDYEVDELLKEMPFHVGWMMEPFYSAQCRFDVYKNSMFNFSAMWAFAVRLGLVTHAHVIDSYQGFNKKLGFSYTEYRLFHAIHYFLSVRRSWLSQKMTSEVNDDLPANIYEFSNYLATTLRRSG